MEVFTERILEVTLSLEERRHRMVEEQIIRRGINDVRVIRAMKEVPRHLFIEDALIDSAYNDHPLPIGCGQTISQPYMVALMTQALQLRGDEKVLEIGTGSGYQAALLAELTEKVYTVDRIPQLVEKAKKVLLDELKYKNIVLLVRDGTMGLPEYAPFDGIIVTAAAPEVPPPLLAQLKEGGRLVIPKGDRFTQTLLVIKKEKDRYITESLGGCVFVPLIGKYGWEEESSEFMEDKT
jgi:protein-L-isoaspartate(D-aspartate) O-methyltransferase